MNNYRPQSQRKKILLLSDDLRMHSGIANQSREFVTGTAHIYNWVQIAGSVKHPDKGKVMNLDKATGETIGIDDAYCRLYPVDGYGDAAVLKQVMGIEKPDVILHFTDPRFWTWLYAIEREIRQECPIAYLNIWDDVGGYPMYNRPYYESCDLLLAISKQTLNINKWVLGPNNCQTIDGMAYDADGKVTNVPVEKGNKPILHYCPHGANVKTFFPLTTPEQLKELAEVKKQVLKKDYKYVIFYNSRNIRRKQTASILLAYSAFCSNLTQEEKSQCVLLLHTAPVDDAGTDLLACQEAFCPGLNVVFSADKILPSRMNQLYNIADVTIHLSDNEGFGIGTAESLMAGTPIIVNVTGGLQDQCGFVEDGKPIEFTREWGTNSDGRIKKHGKWVAPVYPGARMVQGSPMTPYIIGDYGRWEDAAEAMMYWYLLGREKRKECGEEGRRWVSNEGGLNAGNMCDTMVEGIDALLKIWKGRESFNLFRHDEYVGHQMPGGSIGTPLPKIDRDAVLKKFNVSLL